MGVAVGHATFESTQVALRVRRATASHGQGQGRARAGLPCPRSAGPARHRSRPDPPDHVRWPTDRASPADAALRRVRRHGSRCATWGSWENLGSARAAWLRSSSRTSTLSRSGDVAAGSLPAVWERHLVLGPGRDRQGARRHPRVRSGPGRPGQARRGPPGGHRAPLVPRTDPPARGDRVRVAGGTRRAVHRVATLPHDGRRTAAHRTRV